MRAGCNYLAASSEASHCFSSLKLSSVAACSSGDDSRAELVPVAGDSSAAAATSSSSNAAARSATAREDKSGVGHHIRAQIASRILEQQLPSLIGSASARIARRNTHALPTASSHPAAAGCSAAWRRFQPRPHRSSIPAAPFTFRRRLQTLRESRSPSGRRQNLSAHQTDVEELDQSSTGR